MIDDPVYLDFVLEGFKEIAKSFEELEDLLYQWDERCGIRYQDCGEPMEKAEKSALKEKLERMGVTLPIEEKKL